MEPQRRGKEDELTCSNRIQCRDCFLQEYQFPGMGSRRSIEYSSILEMLLCEHTGMFSISTMIRTTSSSQPTSLSLGADNQAIIYVIDSSDTSRLPTSRSELLTMLSEDELKSVPVLVFANKQDVEGALSPGDISDKLGLAGQEKGREWSVRGSCATKGEGLEEGLDW